jgi:hypothetical protein
VAATLTVESGTYIKATFPTGATNEVFPPAEGMRTFANPAKVRQPL